MRLTYLSEAAIPSRASNATQTMRMCAAFAEAGADVTLVHPAMRGQEPEGFDGDVAAFYGLRATFERRRLRVPAVPGAKAVQRVARAAPFLAFLIGRLRPGQPPFVCYARSLLAASMAGWVRRAWGRRSACRAVVIELHDEPPAGGWALLRSLDGVVTISAALRQRLLQELPELESRVWVEHDGVDLGAVRRGMDRQAARAGLGLAHVEGPLVVYAGRVIAGKGVDVLVEAAEQILDIGAHVLVVGKIYEHETVARAPANVTFTGFVAPSAVPEYLAAADVMAMPTTEDLRYAAYTSPLKLFEYMATGNPVVASDLPVLREVLTDGVNALLYPPRDAGALARAVRELWSEPALGPALADQAWQDVQHHGWRARASRILERFVSLAG
ncbi:MAG: glycosyltransferase family 4 protein [Chloroflexi bacterium]|nr:glycosyltransferase family 4 protein [Chloroflexota bacterium]